MILSVCVGGRGEGSAFKVDQQQPCFSHYCRFSRFCCCGVWSFCFVFLVGAGWGECVCVCVGGGGSIEDKIITSEEYWERVGADCVGDWQTETLGKRFREREREQVPRLYNDALD